MAASQSSQEPMACFQGNFAQDTHLKSKNIESKQDSIKTKIFWGEEDTATPLHAGKQIATLSRAELFCPLAGDHFFFLKAAKIIESKCEFK